MESPTALGGNSFRNNFLWGAFILANLVLWIFFGYYIAVNTILRDKALAKFQAFEFGTDRAFVAGASTARQQLSIDFRLNGITRSIPAHKINLNIDSSSAYEYGKGSDIFAVWADALANMRNPVTVLPEITLDSTALLAEFGINLSNKSNSSFWQGDYLLGCETGNYSWGINQHNLASSLIEQSGNDVYELDLNEFVVADRPKQQYELCRKFQDEIQSRLVLINGTSQYEWFTADQIAIDSKGSWHLRDRSSVEEKLKVLATQIDKPATLGDIKEKDGAVWLLSPYKTGQRLDVNATLASLENWLATQSFTFELIREEVFPDILSSGRKIFDFTNTVAAGKSRIDIIRNGGQNVVLKYAQYGIEAMQDVVIMPGQEFSYIDTIKPQPRGRMANGMPIGGGICNATTTMYRAALEAGFPITERSPHGFYVASYDWGYPLNIVDAAYYTNPRVDLKFVNDFDYPVLLQTEITRPGDGWQYHTIYVKTAAAQPERKVEFADWKKYNVYSATRYTGEFTRIVTELSGEEIRRDKFTSRYYR